MGLPSPSRAAATASPCTRRPQCCSPIWRCSAHQFHSLRHCLCAPPPCRTVDLARHHVKPCLELCGTRSHAHSYSSAALRIHAHYPSIARWRHRPDVRLGPIAYSKWISRRLDADASLKKKISAFANVWSTEADRLCPPLKPFFSVL